ncbi:MAG: helix-turn-helix domain-containing protein, partial [Solirubrobacteraceae bacterium]
DATRHQRVASLAVVKMDTHSQGVTPTSVVRECSADDALTAVRQLRARQKEIEDALSAQAFLLDQLVSGIACEKHVDQHKRGVRLPESRLLEQVRQLLTGECVEDTDLGYELTAEHLGVIAGGAGAQDALHCVAQRLDRRLLSVASGEGTIWAWFGGRRNLDMSDVQQAMSELKQSGSVEVDRAEVGGGGTLAGFADLSFAVGEPARGLEGWRVTHQQAQATLEVVLHKPRRFTRYMDVALLAAVLKDKMLAKLLIDIYLTPLEDSRTGGLVLRQTLRAYMAAQRNVSSAAIVLGVARTTVESRLRTVEDRIGRVALQSSAQLEVALGLDELSVLAITTEHSAVWRGAVGTSKSHDGALQHA